MSAIPARWGLWGGDDLSQMTAHKFLFSDVSKAQPHVQHLCNKNHRTDQAFPARGVWQDPYVNMLIQLLSKYLLYIHASPYSSGKRTAYSKIYLIFYVFHWDSIYCKTTFTSFIFNIAKLSKVQIFHLWYKESLSTTGTKQKQCCFCKILAMHWGAKVQVKHWVQVIHS